MFASIYTHTTPENSRFFLIRSDIFGNIYASNKIMKMKTNREIKYDN